MNEFGETSELAYIHGFMKYILSVILISVVVLSMLSGCISVKDYAQAEKNLCDCLSGVLEPADEFCVEWNREVAETWEKLDSRMNRMTDRNPQKALEWQNQIDSVKVVRQICMEAVSKYYGY